MSAQYKTKTPQEFLNQSTAACRACKNFGSTSCPNFRKAIEGGLKPDELKKAIEKDQENRELTPCPNAD